MDDASAAPPRPPDEPEIDASGVDLAQIRCMLDLAPLARLERVSAFTSALVALRGTNAEPQPR